MKRKSLIIISAALTGILGAGAGAFYWLYCTDSGLKWLVDRASGLKSVQLRVEGLEGRLSGPIHIARLEIVHKRAHIVATGIRAHLQLRNLLVQTVYADELHVDSADIALKPRVGPDTQRPPRFLPVPWLTIKSDALDVTRTHLVLQNGQVFDAGHVTGEARLTSRRLALNGIQVADFTLGPAAQANSGGGSLLIAVSGSGEVRAASPIRLGGEWQWTARMAGQPDYSGQLKLNGDLDKLTFTGGLLRPHAAALNGAVLDLTRKWRWTADIAAPAFDFKPWSPQSGAGTFVVTATARGDRDSLQAQAHVEPQALPTGPMDISLAGAYANRRLRTDKLEVRFGVAGKNAAQAALGGSVTTSGEILFAGGFPRLDLRGQWSQLHFPAAAPRVVSRQGSLALAGQLPYTVVASGEWSGAGMPASRFAGNGWLDKDRLTVEAFETHFIPKGGSLSGSAELAWSEKNAWTFTLAARQLDPGIFNRAFPGVLGFTLAGSGHGFEPEGPWQFKLDGLQGQMRTQPVGGHAQLAREGKTWRLGDTELKFGTARLTASGSYDTQPNFQWLLSAEDLSKVLPDAHGKLYSQGRLSGTREQPRLTATLRGSGLEYQQYRVGVIQADTDIDLLDSSVDTAFDRSRLHLQLTASELGLNARTLKSLTISLDGTAADHTLQTKADAGNGQLELTAQGGYVFTAAPAGRAPRPAGNVSGGRGANRARQWQGRVSQLSIAAAGEQLALQAPVPLTLGSERIEVTPFCLTGTPQRVCGNARWQTGTLWTGQLRIDSLPVRLFSAGLPPRARYSGNLSIDAEFTAEPQRFAATASLEHNDIAELTGEAVARRSFVPQPPVISEGSGRNVSSQPTPVGEGRGRNASSQSSGDGAWRRYPLSGSLKGHTGELGFLPALLPEIDRASGELSTNLTLSGTLGAPQFNGSLSLEKGELDLFAVNLLLRDVGLKLDLDGNTLALKAHARAGDGKADVDGKMAWQDGAPKGSVSLKGENLLIANVPEARIQASPDITVNVDGREIQVDGAVRVPYARLAPANLSGAVLPSSDEVIAGTPPQDPKQSFRVTTGVHLILGNDVRIDSYGLSGRLTGSIALFTAPDELSTGSGELRIVENNDNIKGGESKYVAYGRELDIERGRLIFTGGALSDPGVDIRAGRKIGTITAGVNVRGSLRNPRLSFFSDPPLTQTQIASLLVAGRTLDSFQDDATQSGQTREQLIAQGGALIARQLGSQLGIDDVTVESSAGSDSTSLVLGKYLSPRLYVGYGISLAETINTLKLRYTLGDRWTLKIESGENRSADVVYTVDR